jgi:hypothetical protein
MTPTSRHHIRSGSATRAAILLAMLVTLPTKAFAQG